MIYLIYLYLTIGVIIFVGLNHYEIKKWIKEKDWYKLFWTPILTIFLWGFIIAMTTIIKINAKNKRGKLNN